VDATLMAHVKVGDTVIDIGGNIGIYALTLAQRVMGREGKGREGKGREGKVITFEPDPKNFARLSEHLALNPGLNIVARNLGIGADVATHRLYHVVDSNSGMNRIVTAVDLKSQFPYTDVRVAPLSAALRDIPVDRIDVIKIDVEGFEGAVLRGSEDVIRRFKPILFIELNDDNLLENGDSARALINHVEAMGYRVLDGQTELPVPADQALAHCQFDILCLPNS
jgi:FkbM family methyltransferase